MSSYLFIHSHEVLAQPSLTSMVALIEQLALGGHSVRLLLVQNGVMMVRLGASIDGLQRLLDCGVSVTTDRFSLQQREILTGQIREDVGIDEISIVIDALLQGEKVIWM